MIQMVLAKTLLVALLIIAGNGTVPNQIQTAEFCYTKDCKN